jgi:hypothetical protein
MSWSKIIAVTTVVLFVCGMLMIDCAVAGEKMSWDEQASIQIGNK